MHATLDHGHFHFIFGLRLHMQFKCVWSLLLLDDPDKEVQVPIVKLAIDGVRVCHGTHGQLVALACHVRGGAFVSLVVKTVVGLGSEGRLANLGALKAETVRVCHALAL